MPKPVPRGPRPLLERILDTPHLPAVVPRLQPEVLHRVIESCGLHECAELVALATPAQLNRVFDLDLWRPPRPGSDDMFDADRFGDWLEVLMDCGEEVAAAKLHGLDADLVVTGLAQHIAVFDRAAVSRNGHEIGGYLVETRRTGSWDAIAGLLEFLHTDEQELFHRLMAGCRRLSNSTPEADGFHHLAGDREQNMFDLGLAREERREQQGYLTPPQARAFLQVARQVSLTAGAPPARDPIVDAYFRTLDAAPPEAPPPETDNETEVTIATAGVVELLREAGVVADQPRGLLAAGQPAAQETPRLARLHAHLLHALNAGDELAFLANAIVGGCSVQGRPFTEREAADAAMAACNLGLENWPAGWRSPADLVSAFQVGWKTLHDEVAMFAAGRLIDVLGDMQIDDDEMQCAIAELRSDLIRRCQDGAPWVAAETMDVVASLDVLGWTVLVAAIAECPVMHAGVEAARRGARSVSPQAFEFIGGNSQVAAIHEYLQSLESTLLS